MTLEQAQKIVEITFAGKGFLEHLDANGSDNPGDARLAKLGFAADGIGAAQMIGEFGADKLFGVTPTSFSSYSSPAKTIQGFGTPIIGAALLAINGMQLMCGVGAPETGDRFAKGANGFTAISDSLKRATPTDQWRSSGSNAYAAQNEQQQERATAMGKIDSEVKDIIANQAKQIESTRKALEIVATSLTFMIPIAIAIGKVPPTGPAQQMAFELGAVAGSMPIALGAFGTMEARTLANAQKFQQAGNAYQEVAAGAKPKGAPPALVSPPGGNTTSRPWSPSCGASTGTGGGSINV
ncbi:EspA/EspE family type VII secretion system effector [Mycolicibacterium septicum]|uniref:EspA/EspE family type VII secretion system effector n=1 Tax=Mycolicibacterium septicum TaxID=98668 RepID=UPI0023E1BE57|nr:EspA/EspE family type VII secretion system effector [Mycolicibacterium septicum]MDF3341340.1 EspA/EspE family type VII secretion system effector [Mycolicibacterium septicum]